MTEQFDYGIVLRSFSLAQNDGLKPAQLHLGEREVHELMKDSNFMRATTTSTANSTTQSIGRIAGIDVRQESVDRMRIMTAEGEDEYEAYYIL